MKLVLVNSVHKRGIHAAAKHVNIREEDRNFKEGLTRIYKKGQYDDKMN